MGAAEPSERLPAALLVQMAWLGLIRQPGMPDSAAIDGKARCNEMMTDATPLYHDNSESNQYSIMPATTARNNSVMQRQDAEHASELEVGIVRVTLATAQVALLGALRVVASWWIVLIAVAVLTVACTSAGTSARTASGDSTFSGVLADTAGKPSLALPVVTSPARDGDLVLLVTTAGQVRADAAVKLRPEVGGTIAAIRVRPGDAVTKGQTLVTLDPYPFDLAVREAQATADEAEQRLFESYVPESLVTGHTPTPAQRKALVAKSGLTGARLRLERAMFEQTHATIASPFDGRIDVIDVATGERVTAGQPMLTVVDTRNLRIEAQVLEHDLPLVHAGGDARVISAGAPGRVIVGRIDAVLPLVDSTTRAGRALVRVTGDGTLKPGMYADVQLEATRLPSRRLVLARAVIERDGRPLVFIVKDGRAQWTYITPGRSNGRETEVLPDSSSGQIPVQPGDAIIVDGQLTLTHDAPVKAMAAGNVQLRDPLTGSAPTGSSQKGGVPTRNATKREKAPSDQPARVTGARP